MAKRRRTSEHVAGLKRLEKTVRSISARLEHLDTLIRENRRTLEVQFKRMADIQADLDHLALRLKRTG